MRTRFLLVAIFLAGSLGAAPLLGKVSRLRQERSSDVRDKQAAANKALQRGTLKDAARILGDYRIERDPHPDYRVDDLDALVRLSKAVVVGTTMENVCRLSPNGRFITTDYRVQVNEVLLGDDIQPGHTIILSTMGGKVMFEDGTSATVIPSKSRPPLIGENFLMFLSAAKAPHSDAVAEFGANSVFELTAGPLGLFELGSDNKVKSRSRKKDPVVTGISGKDVREFIHDVKKMTTEKKKVRK